MKTRFDLMILGLALTTAPAETLAQPSGYLREIAAYGNDRASSVAADSSGVYVTGSGYGGGFLRKYDFSGNETWTRHWEFVTTTDDINYAGVDHLLATDGERVYFAWGGGQQPVLLMVYGSQESPLWFGYLFNGFPSAELEGLAADDSGFYLAVTTTAGVGAAGRSAAVLQKYDSIGEMQWTREISRTEPPTDYRARAIASDSRGVYLLGSSRRSIDSPFNPHGFLRKYGPGGDELWSRELRGPQSLEPIGVATDGSAVYVLSKEDAMPVVHKYDPNGNELWKLDFGPPNRVVDGSFYFVLPQAIAADASGVYVSGQTNRALPGSCRSGFQDAFVIRFSADGEQLWADQYSGAHDFGSGEAIAVNSAGIFVGGSVHGCGPKGCSTNAAIRKFEHSEPLARGPGPQIFPSCVVNAANYVGGRLSPGEIVAIFGRGLGPEATAAPNLTPDHRFPTELAGVRVLFNGIAAPVISASSDRVGAIVPYAVAGESQVEVAVEYAGAQSNLVTMPLAPSRPGIFTLDGSGIGHVAALNEDGTINSASNPAELGSILVLFATGEGVGEPAVADGSIGGLAPPKPRLPVSVSFCCYINYGWLGEVIYAGAAPGSVAGLLQVNVRISPDIYLDRPSSPEGSVGVHLAIGGQSAGQGNYVFIRGVPVEH